MDEKELEKQQKQAELDEASQKTAHVAGKALATYYGGAKGAQLYDMASKTQLGKDIENTAGKALQKNPIDRTLVKALNDSGTLDKADQALDMASKNKGDAAKAGGEALSKDVPVEKGNADKLKDNNSTSNSGRGLFDNFFGGDSNSNSLDDNESRIGSKIKKQLIIKLAIPLIVFFLVIFLVVMVAASIYYPLEVAKNYVLGIWDSIVDVFTKDKQELEEEYYEELKNVQNNFKINKNICIDINLITASLTVNRTFDEAIDVEDNDQIVTDDDSDGQEYKKMKKQVKLLANMQLITKVYGLDKNLKETTGNYCIYENSSYNQYELVDSDNLEDFKKSVLFEREPLDSSSFELIAQHDDTDEWWNFFTKKSTEEKNYAYYFYRPYFDSDDECDDEIPEEKLEVSIGNYETRKNSVYYWNLINSFIPDYYSEFLPADQDLRNQKIIDIADDIYLLYDEIGPSQTCYVNSSYICRNDEGADFYGGGDKKLSIDEFTQNVSPVAIEEMTRTGIFASITLSQAALESANGASGLSKNYSNYYGMTAGSCAPSQSPDTVTGSVLQPGENGNDCTGNQFWNGSIVALCNSQGEDCQWYRIYDSFANSTRDHSRLLAQSYGCNVYSTYSEQLDCLVAHGYATDPKYKDKITNVINNYSLSDYDIGTFSGTYQDVSESSFVNSMCYGDGFATYAGEFTSWKQYDERWKSVPLGPKTVGEIGCAMTSVTIQILRAGVENILGANLNPGTFATTLTDLGGFMSNGGIYWAAPAKIAPNFQFVDYVTGRYAPPSEIADKINQGYFVILNVKYGGHWVAVDRVEGDKIYMFDPGSGGNEVGHTYGLDSIVGYVYYRRG